MRITKPELKVVRFSSEDVIATSLYYIKNGDDYDIYEANIGNYNTANIGWEVSLPSTPYATISSNFDQYANDNYPIYGIYGTYGEYYTKGVPYTPIAAAIEEFDDGGDGPDLDDLFG